jgi:hypothetical protein
VATFLLAALTIALGVVIFAIGAIHGGGTGIVIGVLFVAAGVGRLVLLRRRHG